MPQPGIGKLFRVIVGASAALGVMLWYLGWSGQRLDGSASSPGTVTSKPQRTAKPRSQPIRGDVVQGRTFETHVLPAFKTRCYECHGPVRQEADLRLDQLATLLESAVDSDAPILPGNSRDSRLMHVVSGHDPDLVMPPEGARLSADEIEAISTWIDAGAVLPETYEDAGRLWSLQPVLRPDVPNPLQESFGGVPVRNDIDRFVLAKLDKAGVVPSGPADDVALVRRLYFDLIGLPPEPARLDAFLTDDRSDRWERLVDELLESPHYGEKWARHWLDQVSYADSDGYEVDHERPNAWRYRNWVIDSINADQPFDEFTRDQIAGDLLENASTEQLVATGLYRTAPFNREAGTKVEQSLFEQTLSRVDTLATVWLGLSMKCAQCHDHKYDPVTQREFYGLFAFLHDMTDREIDAPLPSEQHDWQQRQAEYQQRRMELLTPHDIPRRARELEDVLRKVARDPDALYPSRAYSLYLMMTNYVSNTRRILFTPESERSPYEQNAVIDFLIAKQLPVDGLLESLDALQDSFAPPSAASVVHQPGETTPCRLRIRGDFFTPGDEVEAGTPKSLHAFPTDAPRDRVGLAGWLTSVDNPLTARVIVNRMWEQFFGRGLVSTTDNFGVQGERPSHPTLLDWLAAEFRDGGWSRKQLHRLIVNSATYRQSSHVRTDVTDVDPSNTLLARQARRRLPAELIRDAALSVSGLLNPAVGGRSIKPFQPEGVAELAEGGDARWQKTTGPERFKRGLYIHFQRTTPHPFLRNFDAPEMIRAACQRESSVSPLQALNLMNDPVFFAAARALGDNFAAQSGPRNDRMRKLFRRCLARWPSDHELHTLNIHFDAAESLLRGTPGIAHELCPETPADRRVETAGWILLARLVLNLDEFINR